MRLHNTICKRGDPEPTTGQARPCHTLQTQSQLSQMQRLSQNQSQVQYQVTRAANERTTWLNEINLGLVTQIHTHTHMYL